VAELEAERERMGLQQRPGVNLPSARRHVCRQSCHIGVGELAVEKY